MTFPACRAIAAALILLSAPAVAQAPSDVVTEEICEKSNGLDVPYVPSDDSVLDAMFDLAKPTAQDFVIDLGSGDGRIVIEAARRFGTRGFGVDLNADLVRIANSRAAKAGVADRAVFHVRNLFETDFSRASVLTMYLLPEVVQELRDRILSVLKPGTRVGSHDYHMGAWRPDEIRRVMLPDTPDDAIVYYWVVPGRAAGVWRWEVPETAGLGPGPVEYTAKLGQKYQDVDGTVAVNFNESRMCDVRLVGNRIASSITGEMHDFIVRQDFEGVIDGDRITGTIRMSGSIEPLITTWSAQRVRPVE